MAYVSETLKKGPVTKGDCIFWSGFNLSQARDCSVKSPAEIGIYPLFPVQGCICDFHEIKYSMDLAIQGTQFLNRGQITVLSADQHLDAIIKQFQWHFPETLGDDKLVTMMRALQIEDKMHL